MVSKTGCRSNAERLMLENVGGCGLLLERFREIVGALAQLAKQARVLDGDDGLRGKAFD